MDKEATSLVDKLFKQKKKNKCQTLQEQYLALTSGSQNLNEILMKIGLKQQNECILKFAKKNETVKRNNLVH